jgi:hypothetical protein
MVHLSIRLDTYSSAQHVAQHAIISHAAFEVQYHSTVNGLQRVDRLESRWGVSYDRGAHVDRTFC